MPKCQSLPPLTNCARDFRFQLVQPWPCTTVIHSGSPLLWQRQLALSAPVPPSPPPQSVCALEDALGSLHWFLYKYGNWVLLSVKMREERNIGAAEEDTYGSPFLPTTLPFLSPKGPCQGPPAEGRHDQRMQVSHALASTVRPRA